MDNVIFIAMSMLEGLSIFYFMLTLFRFKIKDYVLHIFFSISIVTAVSFVLRVIEGMYDFVPVIIVLTLILLLSISFRIPILYASIMGFAGFVFYTIIQALALFFMSQLDILTFQQLKDNVYLGVYLQIVSILILFLLTLGIKSFKIWVTFIPVERYSRKLRNSNAYMVMVMLICVITVSVVYMLDNIGIVAICFVLVAYLVAHYIYIREKSDD